MKAVATTMRAYRAQAIIRKGAIMKWIAAIGYLVMWTVGEIGTVSVGFGGHIWTFLTCIFLWATSVMLVVKDIGGLRTAKFF